MLFVMLLFIGHHFTYADDGSYDFMLVNNQEIRENADIWERMRDSFKINLSNKRVRHFEKIYSKDQKTFNNVIRNSSIYLYYVLSETERLGLPGELALIPIIETNYNAFAVNGTGRYDGIWQFVPATATDFNLHENADLNDRRNIVKSTQAAMLYLNYLNLTFKQWDVAIGAYNWGIGNMYKAIVRSHQSVGDINYTKLPLRQITADYVPKIVAIANIIKNPSKFGITLPNLSNTPYFTINKINNSTIADVVKLSETDKKIFAVLNPHYKNLNYTPDDKSVVLLPVQNYAIYAKNAVIDIGDSDSNNFISDDISNLALKDTDGDVKYDNDGLVMVNDDINQIGYNDGGRLQKAVSINYKTLDTDNSTSDDDIENIITKATTEVSNNNNSVAVVKSNNAVEVPSLIVAKYAPSVSNSENYTRQKVVIQHHGHSHQYHTKNVKHKTQISHKKSQKKSTTSLAKR